MLGSCATSPVANVRLYREATATQGLPQGYNELSESLPGQFG